MSTARRGRAAHFVAARLAPSDMAADGGEAAFTDSGRRGGRATRLRRPLRGLAITSDPATIERGPSTPACDYPVTPTGGERSGPRWDCSTACTSPRLCRPATYELLGGPARRGRIEVTYRTSLSMTADRASNKMPFVLLAARTSWTGVRTTICSWRSAGRSGYTARTCPRRRLCVSDGNDVREGVAVWAGRLADPDR